MSALNCFRFPNAVAVVTDAAIYDDTGTLWRIAPKAVTVSHLRAVIAARGPMMAAPILAQELGGSYLSFDALIENVESALPEFVLKHSEFLSFDPDPRIEVMIAGWSRKRDRPEAYLICTGPETAPAGEVCGDLLQVAAGQLIVLPEQFISPAILKETLARSGVQTSRPLTFDQTALVTLQLQRDIVYEGARWVGGFGLMHLVTREGVSERVICRWDDHLDEPISLDQIDWPAWRAENGWPDEGPPIISLSQPKCEEESR